MNWLKNLFKRRSAPPAIVMPKAKDLLEMTLEELEAENRSLAFTQDAIKNQRKRIAALIEEKTNG